MMYKNQLAVAIKHNGKVLRENKDLVYLPFGSEFSVLVKNLNSRRVKFTLDIDGTNVLDSTEIIVDANSEVEVKRFIRNGNMNEGNAFKFIERTKTIEDGPRGVKVDDGIVRVEFWFEKEKPEVKEVIHHHKNYWWDTYYYPYNRRTFWLDGPYYGSISSHTTDAKDRGIELSSKGVFQGAPSGTFSTNAASSNSANTFNAISGSAASIADVKLGGPNAPYRTADRTKNISSDAQIEAQTAVNEVGITVPGSKVEQKFHTVYGFNSEEQSHVIILRLAGTNNEVEVLKPVTVDMKPKCITCGRLNKAKSNYCTTCGTALTVL